ncbi:hypothetical protein [Culicoidibacter larvae]|uniref:Uncharacterized protein n=1 Tax=Culicoidibacter larvae TaxID=2579976 RepID=A0A5R8QFD2_9FIRM|nr:hypothetical protein [Culicoidibacter larvae]TLG76698.1 hypothetical protein FEZ08_03530 [Culicoidibacter larvae]
MRFLKNKGLWAVVSAVIVVVIIILLLLRGCAPTILDADSYTTEVTSLIDKNKSGQDKWNFVLGDTDFVDLCTEPYAAEFDAIGQQFIDRADEFDALRVNGDPRSIVANYDQYVQYFSTYRSIGEELKTFANSVRSGDYQAALAALEQLELLNKQLPVIE